MPIAHDSLLYSRVETALASEIADGDLRLGDQLSTEDSLVARFGVSRITVRRAIQNLVSRGLVEIRRGKGTFVAAPKITQELTELSGFVEDMRALGTSMPTISTWASAASNSAKPSSAPRSAASFGFSCCPLRQLDSKILSRCIGLVLSALCNEQPHFRSLRKTQAVEIRRA